jgi:putative colanic acid biosynthesis acetyltransferase WcaF
MIHGEETRVDKREHLKVALDVYKDRAEDHQNPIKWGLWYGISIVFFETRWPWPSRIKVFLLKCFGAKVGRGVVIKPGVRIKFPWKLSVGDYVWVGDDVWIDNLASVEVGSHVCISQGAYLLTGNHDYKSPCFNLMAESIKIEDGVWIAAKAVIAPGSVIESHAVITAGSILVKRAEAYKIYQGNPAMAIRDRKIEPK